MAENLNYDLLREGEDKILKVPFEDYHRVPSLEEDPFVMSKIIDILVKVKEATKIVLTQKRDYEYDFNQKYPTS